MKEARHVYPVPDQLNTRNILPSCQKQQHLVTILEHAKDTKHETVFRAQTSESLTTLDTRYCSSLQLESMLKAVRRQSGGLVVWRGGGEVNECSVKDPKSSALIYRQYLRSPVSLTILGSIKCKHHLVIVNLQHLTLTPSLPLCF